MSLKLILVLVAPMRGLEFALELPREPKGRDTTSLSAASYREAVEQQTASGKGSFVDNRTERFIENNTRPRRKRRPN